MHKISRALADPGAGRRYVITRLKGQLFRLHCALFRPRVKIGRGLKIHGRLLIRGPGRVTIGDNVEIGRTVTPCTHDVKAHIVIGDRTFLNGTRFGCQTGITIGRDCILGDCHLADTDFHSTNPRHRNDPAYVKTAPIRIEDNVWITGLCIVLKGTTIGRDSTITVNSVVTQDIPAACVAGGNPARVIRFLREEELS